MKVYIVDDDADMIEVMKLMLDAAARSVQRRRGDRHSANRGIQTGYTFDRSCHGGIGRVGALP